MNADARVYRTAADIIQSRGLDSPDETGPTARTVGAALCRAAMLELGTHASDTCRQRMDAVARSLDSSSLRHARLAFPDLDWPEHLRSLAGGA